MRLFATYLVLEECIPGIFHHSGHDQNVVLTFLVSLDADTIVERDGLISDRPESAGRGSAYLLLGIYRDHLLE